MTGHADPLNQLGTESLFNYAKDLAFEHLARHPDIFGVVHLITCRIIHIDSDENPDGLPEYQEAWQLVLDQLLIRMATRGWGNLPPTKEAK